VQASLGYNVCCDALFVGLDTAVDVVDVDDALRLPLENAALARRTVRITFIILIIAGAFLEVGSCFAVNAFGSPTPHAFALVQTGGLPTKCMPSSSACLLYVRRFFFDLSFRIGSRLRTGDGEASTCSKDKKGASDRAPCEVSGLELRFWASRWTLSL